MRGLLCMQKVNSSFLLKVLPRAFLIFLICFSLVAFTSYTAPKAQAEAVTLSLVTAFLMLAVAVMATLGVTLTASSNQAAIDYISDPFLSFLQGKGYSSISDYLASVGITSVTQLCIPVFGAVNIVKTVYDIIAEFCTSFFAENNIVSGGNDVGDLPGNPSFQMHYYNSSYLRGSISATGFSADTVEFVFSDWYSSSSSASPYTFIYVPLSFSIPVGYTTFNFSRSVADGFTGSIPSLRVAVRGNDGTNYAGNAVNFDSSGVGSWTFNNTGIDNITGSTTLILYIYASTNHKSGSIRYTVNQSSIPFESDSFVISPSSTVLAPPQVSTGQTYSIPSSNTHADDDTDKAINDVVAPLTTTDGLSKTATVAGKAVPAEFEWLYEDTQAIRNNTNPHFDFIPSSLGFDFAIWHYVTEMMTAVSDSFALLGTFISNMPPAVLVFPFGVFALAITVALFRRFLS